MTRLESTSFYLTLVSNVSLPKTFTTLQQQPKHTTISRIRLLPKKIGSEVEFDESTKTKILPTKGDEHVVYTLNEIYLICYILYESL